MARKLTVSIDDELEKDMRAHPEVNWVEVAIKAIRDCIRDRDNCRFYHTMIDRAMSQERKQGSKQKAKVAGTSFRMKSDVSLGLDLSGTGFV